MAPKRGPYPLIGTVRINPLPFPAPPPPPIVPMRGSFIFIISTPVCINLTLALNQGPKFPRIIKSKERIRVCLAPSLKPGIKLPAMAQRSGSKLKSSPSPPFMRSLMMLSMSHSRFSKYMSRSRS